MQLIFIGILLLVFGYQQVELSHVAAHSKQPDPEIWVGGIHDVDPQTEPGIDALIYVALKHVESEKTVHYRLIEILRLQEQLVNGLIYILTVEMGPTACPKSVEYPGNECPFLVGAKPIICEVTFIEYSWVHSGKNVIENNCTQSQSFNEWPDCKLHKKG